MTGDAAALAPLVLALADNKQLLGLRYAEWSTRAPSLEADIAAAAMGLDDLGHSRVLYGCLEALGNDPRRGGADRDSDRSSYRVVRFLDEPWSEWSEFVAANAVLDTAFSCVLEACAGGSSEVLQARLRKMLQEERFHFLHARSWLRSGIDRAVLERAWKEALEFIGPPDGDLAALHGEGLLGMGPADLRKRLAERLEMPAPEIQVDWAGWDADRRRTVPGELDERTFDMLRGLEEKRFMPGTAAAT